MDGDEEARRRPVVSGGDGAEAVEGVEAALDAVAQGVVPAPTTGRLFMPVR